MAVTLDQLEQLYLAYFGRPADFNGVAFYTADPTVTILDVAATFGSSAESQALYGPGFNVSVINAIYQNLFNRDADPEGLLFWSQAVARGDVTPAGAALAILQGAKNADATMIANKLAAATAFTNALNTAPEILGYAGQNAAALARTQLHSVTDDASTLTAYVGSVDSLINAVIGVGGTIGQTLSLTKSTDSVDLTTNSQTIDTVRGVIDAATAGNSTYSAGDVIKGNGKTIVDLAVTSGGTTDFVTMSNVKTVHFTAGAAANLSVSALGWSSVGAVELTNGVNGADIFVNGLNDSASLTLANVTGTLSASFTGGVNVEEQMFGGKGSVSNVGNNVVATAAGATQLYYFQKAEAAGVAQTIGNVTFSGSGVKTATFSVMNDQAKGGDITVGNINMSGGKNLYAYAFNSHTAKSAATNITIGDVTLTQTGAGGQATFTAQQSNTAGAIGDITVGNISVTVAKSSSGEAHVQNYTSANSGNVQVGNINVTGANDAYVSAEIYQYASQATGSTAATIGTTTVGNVTMSVGNDTTAGHSAQAYFEVGVYADSTNTAGATVGNVTVGSVTMTAGQSASATYSVTVTAESGGDNTIGDVTLGAVNLTGGVSADLSYSVDVTASGTGVSTVGTVSVANVTVTGSIGSTYDGHIEVYALGSSKSDIAGLATGNFALNGDDGADFNQFNQMTSDGTIGFVSIGDVSSTMGVSASVNFTNEIYGHAGVGDVTIGSMTADVTKKNGYAYVYNSITSTTGAIGNTKIGDVSLKTGNLGTADWYAYVEGATGVGTTTLGNVTLSAVSGGTSANAFGQLYVSDSGAGTIGAVTVGNVNLTATGVNAHNTFEITVSNALNGGTLTVGDVTLNVGETAKKAGALATFKADNELGAVKIGNITLNASGARGTGDATMAYDANITVTAGNGSAITIGNITVTGTGSKAGGAENFQTFTNVLTLNTTGTKTIGNVDYSGYGAAATIDVQTFKGAASIIGTAKGDTFTDNKGTNSITGGAGADTFDFVTANTNKTAATADVITDFSQSQGDIIKIGAGLAVALDPNTNYGEANFADFTSFLSTVSKAGKEIYVGQVGSDSYVAVDHDGGGVDFVIKLVGVGLAGVDVTSFA
jgi:hypothetical protein